MKKTLCTLACAAAALSAGCTNQASTGGTSAGGSLGLSHDDALLYAADPDLDTVFVVDAKSQTSFSAVKVGRAPEKVLVGPDDTVYVTNRLGRSVSVLRRGDPTESARIPVAVEPVGLAMAADGKTLYVVNSTALSSTEFGTLMAIDTGSLQVKWETPVGAEPRAVALLGNGHAAVSLYKAGDVVLVDVDQGKVISGSSDLYQRLNTSALTGKGPGLDNTSHPRGLEAILPAPTGDQFYVTARLASDAVLATTPSGTPVGVDVASAGYGASTCGATAVTVSAVLTLSSDGEPKVDDLGTCASNLTDRPTMLLTSSLPGLPVQGARAIATDPTGSFLYIANTESNNVAIVPTSTRTATSPFGLDGTKSGFTAGGTVDTLVSVGAGPTGIAVSHDGRFAYVFNSFDHSLTTLAARSDKAVVAKGTVTLGADVLPADVVQGRKLFNSAVDARMNSLATGIACASCHLEGREDGHVWNFPEGPRQTPSLAARMLAKTAPYHWNGEFSDLNAFMATTVQRRMGGSGVTGPMEAQLTAFLDSQPTPDNPYRDTTSAEQLARGKAVYAKAGCDACHVGEALTNNSFANVGTYVVSGRDTDDLATLPHHGLNTPSLLGLARTAPYLHDGSAPSLKARILKGKETNQHGTTAALTDAEVDDLVAFIRTF